nr:response regulator [Aeoliella straminimaris]
MPPPTAPKSALKETQEVVSVLVVDDSRFMTRVVKSALESLGVQVVGVAGDGLEALEQFQQHRPDVTLLDITMPNMDGLECLTRIREIDADARVVMLSAVQDEETVAKCLKLGAATFLRKPIRMGNSEDEQRLQLALGITAPQIS